MWKAIKEFFGIYEKKDNASNVVITASQPVAPTVVTVDTADQPVAAKPAKTTKSKTTTASGTKKPSTATTKARKSAKSKS